MAYSWKELIIVSLTALAVVVGCDMLLHRIVPPVQRREVEDGVRDFERLNPDILVLGSSHGRTLHVLGQELSRRTGGARTLVSVPLENGKIVPYRWVLEHRLAPLIERRDAQGQLEKTHLKQFVLITEWWDSCEREDHTPYWNLPARAWTFGDFLEDVGGQGITGFNRNYLQTRLRRLLPSSALIYDRTQQQAVIKLMDVVRGRPLTMTPEEYADKMTAWRGAVERGIHCIGNAQQMEALRAIADYAQGRGFEMTILLFPRKPGTLTPKARDTTLSQFASLIHHFADPRGIRVVDLTSTSPLRDDEFMEDFDHVNADGNRRFAAWALDHDLGFLAQPLGQSAVGLASAKGGK